MWLMPSSIGTFEEIDRPKRLLANRNRSEAAVVKRREDLDRLISMMTDPRRSGPQGTDVDPNPSIDHWDWPMARMSAGNPGGGARLTEMKSMDHGRVQTAVSRRPFSFGASYKIRALALGR